jgi:hypothetical protein
MDPLTPPHPFSALHSGAKKAGFLSPEKFSAFPATIIISIFNKISINKKNNN